MAFATAVILFGSSLLDASTEFLVLCRFSRLGFVTALSFPPWT